MRKLSVVLPVLILLALSAVGLTQAQAPIPQSVDAVPTTFTYQGYLANVSNQPVSGNCAFRLQLYDAASSGNQVGSVITSTQVISGYFTLPVDFGASAFAGAARWIETSVKCPGDADYTTLPRQALNAVPYAQHSISTSALQGRAVDSSAPSAGQILKWNGSAWTPEDDDVSTVVSGTNIYAGQGLYTVASGNSITLNVSFAGTGNAVTVARSDHDHNGVYAPVAHTHAGEDITSPVAQAISATQALTATNANMLGGQPSAHYQARVGGICSTGSAIRLIGADGSVTCQDVSTTLTATYATTATYAITSTIATTATYAADADTLDGQHASAFAPAAHTHAGEDITTGIVAEPRIDAAIARTDQITPTVWAADGAGSGLDADLLDGQHSAFYQQRVSGTCDTGNAIRVIGANGTVICEPIVVISFTTIYAGQGLYSVSSGNAMTLNVSFAGTGVATTVARSDHNHTGVYAPVAHTHSGADITSGTVADARIASTIARDSEITPTVWAADGAGSSLDADLLDGKQSGNANGNIPISNGTVNTNLNADLLDGSHASAFAASSHTHSGADITTGTVADARIASTIARDSEITPTVWAADGAGSGLDADLLDGKQSGNTSGNIPVSNGTLNTNLNADLLDGYQTGNASGNVPLSNGTLNTNLNADLLDGQHSTYYQARVSGACAVGSTIRAINADGTVTCESHDAAPLFSRSAVQTTNDVGHYSSIVIGVDGLGLISYYDTTNGNLMVAHCNNAACTSATASTLDSTNDVGLWTSIAIGSDGFGLISYYDNTAKDLKVAHCSDTNCTAATLTTLDSTNDVGWYTSVAAGSDGYGLIAYQDHTSGYLKVVHCGNVTCNSGNTTTTLDNSAGAGATASMAIGADGLGLIGYEANSAALKVAHCNDVACTGATVSSLDSGTIGPDVALTVGRDGVGLISYHNNTAHSLKVAHCSNVNCTAATLATLDSTDDVGNYTTITIGSDGRGMIIHSDATVGGLRATHCNNEICATATTVVLDSTTGITFSAISIGPDGMPLISYKYFSLGDLKVAHCSNVYCVPYARSR